MVRENSSPINGENQRFWKHLSKIFLPGRRSRCTFSQTPLTPTWEKSCKVAPPPENFFSTRIIIVVFSLHFLMSKIELFGNHFRKFFEFASHEYQQPSITPMNHAGIASCQRLHIARCPSMQKSRQSGNPFGKLLLKHSVQHRLQRVLSSYGQLSFHLPLHIYMAKISDFGNN